MQNLQLAFEALRGQIQQKAIKIDIPASAMLTNEDLFPLLLAAGMLLTVMSIALGFLTQKWCKRMFHIFTSRQQKMT